MTSKRSTSTTSTSRAAQQFATAAEAAVADLEANVAEGMAPLQQALAARIRHAVKQLVACAKQLESEELVVLGSTGQRRPHPLLKAEQDLRKETSEGLKDLTFRAEQHAMFVQAQRVTGHEPRRYGKKDGEGA